MVRLVEVQQILALDVENERPRLRSRRPQQRATVRTLEHHVEQEQRVARLRRHAADAADRDVAALHPVHEAEVAVDRLQLLVKADRQPPAGHLIEEQRGFTISAHARSAGPPGAGATHSSGTVRSTLTCALRLTCPGIVCASAMWRVSEGSSAPSITAGLLGHDPVVGDLLARRQRLPA